MDYCHLHDHGLHSGSPFISFPPETTMSYLRNTDAGDARFEYIDPFVVDGLVRFTCTFHKQRSLGPIGGARFTFYRLKMLWER